MRFNRVCTRLQPHVRLRPACFRHASTSASLIEVLRRNKEISAEDAINELRWIRQAIREDPSLVETHRHLDDEGCLAELVGRRAAGEPLQYVLGTFYPVSCLVKLRIGTTDFGPLVLRTRAPVLIPRPETAHITERIAHHLLKRISPSSAPLNVLDLCTGSGCIALLLKHLLDERGIITGRDISQAALSLARDNAHQLGLNVTFETGDIWGNVESWRKVDILVSNPPYIPRKEWDGLDDGVRHFEDPAALVGDPSDLPPGPVERAEILHGQYEDEERSGLAFYRRIANILPVVLTPQAELVGKGWNNVPRVAVEIGYNQAEQVQSILKERSGGWIKQTEVWKDQYDVDRMVVGWK